MGLYSENPAIEVKKKKDVLYHNIFAVLRYVSKKLMKIITNEFRSHLMQLELLFFTLFCPYSLFLQGITMLPPMTHFPSGEGLGWLFIGFS